MKRRSRLVLVLLVGACSEGGSKGTVAPVSDANAEGGDARTGDAMPADATGETMTTDATTTDQGTPDVSSPPAACDPSAPFGTPVLLAGTDLNTTNEEGGPRLTADELTIYFSSRRLYGYRGASSLWVAHRSSMTAPFDTPSPLTTLDWPTEIDAAIPLNGNFDPTTVTQLALFFSSDRPGGLGPKDLWTASRTSAANAFDPPGDLAAPMNSPQDDAQPFLTSDGSELWFSSSRPQDAGGGAHDIYRSVQSGGTFTSPALVGEISSPLDDYCPTLSIDKLVIFFSSNRANGGTTLQDIFTASRVRVTDPFSNVSEVTAVSSPADDYPGWLSPDGCRLYMSSTRQGGVGSEDLYLATRGR